jgi:hypothetical protein
MGMSISFLRVLARFDGPSVGERSPFPPSLSEFERDMQTAMLCGSLRRIRNGVGVGVVVVTDVVVTDVGGVNIVVSISNNGKNKNILKIKIKPTKVK